MGGFVSSDRWQSWQHTLRRMWAKADESQLSIELIRAGRSASGFRGSCDWAVRAQGLGEYGFGVSSDLGLSLEARWFRPEFLSRTGTRDVRVSPAGRGRN